MQKVVRANSAPVARGAGGVQTNEKGNINRAQNRQPLILLSVVSTEGDVVGSVLLSL